MTSIMVIVTLVKFLVLASAVVAELVRSDRFSRTAVSHASEHCSLPLYVNPYVLT